MCFLGEVRRTILYVNACVFTAEVVDKFLFGIAAYTNDVVNAIQRSRMLICLLSADYLCDSNAVFVLESGVQVRPT